MKSIFFSYTKELIKWLHDCAKIQFTTLEKSVKLLQTLGCRNASCMTMVQGPREQEKQQQPLTKEWTHTMSLA